MAKGGSYTVNKDGKKELVHNTKPGEIKPAKTPEPKKSKSKAKTESEA